jgi:hypothetical protein
MSALVEWRNAVGAAFADVEGPWQHEPDKVQWVDEVSDLDCLILRNRFGALCGYVGLPPGHPWHGLDYEDIDADPHGDLTFAGPCDPGAAPEDGICHVPGPGRPDDLWWVGFDCAHWCDLHPRAVQLGDAWPVDGHYRTVAYVGREVTRLACQALNAV